MNALSYGLLSLLTQQSCTGYDLMGKLNLFWPASHSQIYPLLAKLVKKEFVIYQLVEQTDKPDKKVYTLTEQGRQALKLWMTSPTAEPMMRDEHLLKTFCIHLIDPSEARTLFNERVCYYEKNKKLYERTLDEMRHNHASEAQLSLVDFQSPDFGTYILMQKAVWSTEMNLKWCQWVISILP